MLKLILFLVFIYTILAVFYLKYRTAQYLIKRKRYKPAEKNSDDVSIIIPHYNEDPHILKSVLELAIQTKYQVILVDDYSTKNLNELNKIIAHFSQYPNFLYLKNAYEKGKRQAQRTGIERANTKYVILMDSDTYTTREAISTLIRYLEANPEVGGATANIKLINEDENLLTKTISYRYHYAFEIERVAQTNWGVLTCLSGVLTAYRREDILPLMDKYTNQKFMGKPQQIGDDRHLTTLLIQSNKTPIMVREAIAFTLAPNKLRQYIKQQIRWKQSYIRESIILLLTTNPLKKPLLFFENTYLLLLTYFAQFMRVLGAVAIALNPLSAIYLSILIITINAIRNLPLASMYPRAYLYSFLYAFLHETIISWTLIPATINTLFGRSKWLTR